MDIFMVQTLQVSIKLWCSFKWSRYLSIVTTRRHAYGSYLWHKVFDLGVIAKIQGIKIQC